MSKEKQIEEMAKLTCNSQRSCYKGDCIGSEVCAVRENCEKLYNAGYRKQEWISVAERLPEPNKSVLCIWERGGDRMNYGFARYQSSDVWYVSNEGMPRVTHWMPLPEPPKGD